MKRKQKFPSWYHQTTPDIGYPGIDEGVHELVYLLRNNGWNTSSSCGSEYKGLVIIECYDEQSGWMHEHGGPVNCLRVFLETHGYQHFEIKHIVHNWHGKVVEKILVLKILGPEYLARWK